MCRHSLLVLVSSVLCSINSMGMAHKSRLPTMLVVPAHYSQLQVAFDIANRYNTLLVSYQGGVNSSEPLLHVWSGDKWIQISMHEYRTASFLTVRPDRVFMIGDEHVLPPSLVEASDTWSSLVMSSPSTSTADIVNSFGKVAGFRRHDWEWFASRYNLDFQDLNASERSHSWYDRSPASVRNKTWTGKDVGTESGSETEMVQIDDESLQPRIYATQETTNGTNQIKSSMPRASVHTNSDIVIDNIPSVSDIQRNIDTTVGDTSTSVTVEFKGLSLPFDWEEEPVATELPLK